MKVDERNLTIKKFIPPPDAISDPVEREELLMQADIFNGLSALKF